ncbi:MAG: LysR family transcriptional regulator [Proteobacteria bacterium]|nr:LysR family transcriptional regulator [Pseudomonadota bacterium]NOG60609.1 LysR family transcriptional regulator [Pseudomonadota bacterium]
MNDIDIGLLRTFMILADTQSFTQTAKRVYRSQSAVSMQIAKLEELLDCTLFIRDKRNVKLTVDGERLRHHASQIVSLSDNLMNQFIKDEVVGNINFASPEDFATHYLPDILADFVKSHPRITLNVNCDLTLTLLKEFKEDKYDLIVIKQEPGRIYKDAKPLTREELVWVGHNPDIQEITFTKTKKNCQKKYGYFPLVLSPAPCVYRQGALEALDKAGVPWKIVYTSPSFAGAIAAVKAGLGFTVFPREMVSKNLTVYESSRGWPKLKSAEICLLAKPNTTPAIESLIDYIIERISIIKTM